MVSDKFAARLGCLLLFMILALAVGIFIHRGMKLHGYEFWEKEPIETVYGVDGMVRERQSHYASSYTQLLIGGVTLCVLCPTPIFGVLVLFGEENE